MGKEVGVGWVGERVGEGAGGVAGGGGMEEGAAVGVVGAADCRAGRQMRTANVASAMAAEHKRKGVSSSLRGDAIRGEI